MTQQDNRFYKELSSLQGGIDNQQLLDDFAKAAMQGIVSRYGDYADYSIIAHKAYDIATALMQERERRMKG